MVRISGIFSPHRCRMPPKAAQARPTQRIARPFDYSKLDPVYTALDDQDYIGALKSLNSLILSYGDHPSVLTLKAIALTRLRREEEFQANHQKLVALNLSDPGTLKLWSHAYKSRDDFHALIAVYENALKLRPKDEELLKGLFKLYGRALNYSKQQQLAMNLFLSTKNSAYLIWSNVAALLQHPQYGPNKMLELGEKLLIRQFPVDAPMPASAFLVLAQVILRQAANDAPTRVLELLDSPMGSTFLTDAREDAALLRVQLQVRVGRLKDALACAREEQRTAPDNWRWTTTALYLSLRAATDFHDSALTPHPAVVPSATGAALGGEPAYATAQPSTLPVQWLADSRSELLALVPADRGLASVTRAPHLGMLEAARLVLQLHATQRTLVTPALAAEAAALLLAALVSYYARFSSKPCFFDDVAVYMQALPHAIPVAAFADVFIRALRADAAVASIADAVAQLQGSPSLAVSATSISAALHPALANTAADAGNTDAGTHVPALRANALLTSACKLVLDLLTERDAAAARPDAADTHVRRSAAHFCLARAAGVEAALPLAQLQALAGSLLHQFVAYERAPPLNGDAAALQESLARYQLTMNHLEVPPDPTQAAPKGDSGVTYAVLSAEVLLQAHTRVLAAQALIREHPHACGALYARREELAQLGETHVSAEGLVFPLVVARDVVELTDTAKHNPLSAQPLRGSPPLPAGLQTVFTDAAAPQPLFGGAGAALVSADQFVLDALAVITFALRAYPKDVQLQLWALRLAAHPAVADAATVARLSGTDWLDIKQVQLDTLAYLVHSDLLRYGHVAAAAELASRAVLFYERFACDTPDMVMLAYQQSAYAQVQGLAELHQRIARSMQQWTLLADAAFTALLRGDSFSSSTVAEALAPRLTKLNAALMRAAKAARAADTITAIDAVADTAAAAAATESVSALAAADADVQAALQWSLPNQDFSVLTTHDPAAPAAVLTAHAETARAPATYISPSAAFSARPVPSALTSMLSQPAASVLPAAHTMLPSHALAGDRAVTKGASAHGFLEYDATASTLHQAPYFTPCTHARADARLRLAWVRALHALAALTPAVDETTHTSPVADAEALACAFTPAGLRAHAATLTDALRGVGITTVPDTPESAEPTLPHIAFTTPRVSALHSHSWAAVAQALDLCCTLDETASASTRYLSQLVTAQFKGADTPVTEAELGVASTAMAEHRARWQAASVALEAYVGTLRAAWVSVRGGLVVDALGDTAHRAYTDVLDAPTQSSRTGARQGDAADADVAPVTEQTTGTPASALCAGMAAPLICSSAAPALSVFVCYVLVTCSLALQYAATRVLSPQSWKEMRAAMSKGRHGVGPTRAQAQAAEKMAVEAFENSRITLANVIVAVKELLAGVVCDLEPLVARVDEWQGVNGDVPEALSAALSEAFKPALPALSGAELHPAYVEALGAAARGRAASVREMAVLAQRVLSSLDVLTVKKK